MSITLPVTPKAIIEEEQALIVRSENPLKTFKSLMELPAIKGFKLADPEEHVIVDRFYDTKESAIRSLKSSLRIRTLDGVPYVTVKGKNKNSDLLSSTSSKRDELEFRWPYEEPTAFDLVALFGLVEKQMRITKRTSRNIIKNYWEAGKKDSVIVGELALDTVTYQFNGTPNATLYEVEVELKSDKTDVKLDDIVAPLLKLHPELEPWKHSKFSTGKALEISLQVNLDEQGVVTDRSFDIIRYLLDS